MIARPERLEGCESLRGIAITLVFFYHFLGSLSGYGPNPQASHVTALLFGGSTGVDLFFVLSGFLLSMPYLRGNPLVPRQFFANRALRILPMYYLVLLIAAAWRNEWHAVPGLALFQGIGLDTLPPFGLVWWSLVVEVQFYLALPVAVWLARGTWEKYVLTVALVGLCVCYWNIAAATATPFWADQRNALTGRWPQFAVGIAAAWVHCRFSERMHAMSARQRRWIGSALALAALFVLDALTTHGLRKLGVFQFAFWYAHYLYLSMAWGVFLVAVIDLAPLCHVLAINRIWHRLGEWSYSIYLTHAAFVVFAVLRLNINPGKIRSHDLVGNTMLFIYIAGATLLVSATTYYLIERPCMRLKHSRFLTIGRIREDAM